MAFAYGNLEQQPLKMMKQAKIPRITSINHIDGFILICTFNTGEQRKLDMLTFFLTMVRDILTPPRRRNN